MEALEQFTDVEIKKGISYLMKLLARGINHFESPEDRGNFHENFIRNLISNFLFISMKIDEVDDTLVRIAISAMLMKISLQVLDQCESKSKESNKTKH